METTHRQMTSGERAISRRQMLDRAASSAVPRNMSRALPDNKMVKLNSIPAHLIRKIYGG